LPTLPQVAVEVSRLAANPVTAMPELVRVIHDDPSLTAKILRVANSAFYGMSGNVESLNMALSILGMRELIHLVTCISVFHAFPVKPGQPTFDRQSFWIHSAGCGEIARDLSKRLNLRFKSSEFTAGLLHDLGKIVLDQYFHDDFMEALKLSYSEDLPMIKAENQVLGVNHTQVGWWLAELWNLPKNICEAIAHHHDSRASSAENRPLVAIISLANAFCKSVGVGFSGNTTEERIIGGPAWEILKWVQPHAAEFDVEAFQFEIEDNIARAQEFVSIALT
jgi:HD-like signal output (HDOD) protein